MQTVRRILYLPSLMISTLLLLGGIFVSDVNGQITTSWQLASSSGPSARWGHGMAYDDANGITVLFGGDNTNETWYWDGLQWAQLFPLISPAGRTLAVLVYDTKNREIILFGGENSTTTFDDTWVYDFNTNIWTQLAVSGPVARTAHAMVFNAWAGTALLFGGDDFNGISRNDTWVWDGNTNTWTQQSPATAPSLRSGHAMAYDVWRDVVVLYGGSNGSSETWEWDGTNWIQKFPANNPGFRNGHKMAFDIVRGVTVLYGGNDFPLNLDTWEWNGNDWVHITNGAPGPHSVHNMTFDFSHRQMVLFGGVDQGGVSQETWIYGVREGDFGDAPDPGFPTLLTTTSTSYPTKTGPYHWVVGQEWIGTTSASTTTIETEGQVIDLDFDDGFPEIKRAIVGGSQSKTGFLTITISIAPGTNNFTRYLNVAVDFNADGEWATYEIEGATYQEEWIVKNYALYLAPTETTVRMNCPFNWLDDNIDLTSPIWLRATLTTTETIDPFIYGNGIPGWDGSGPVGGFARGETEDWYLTPTTFTFHPVPAGLTLQPQQPVQLPANPIPGPGAGGPGPGAGGPGPGAGVPVGPGNPRPFPPPPEGAGNPPDSSKEKHPLPDIDQDPMECAPTAVANSLYYLGKAFGFSDSLPGSPSNPDSLIEMLKRAMKWNYADGVHKENFVPGKKELVRKLGLPIVTRSSTSLEWIISQLNQCEDVEILLRFDDKLNGKDGHTVTAAGYTIYPNGDIEIKVHDPNDSIDGDAAYPIGTRYNGKPYLRKYPRSNWIMAAVSESPYENIPPPHFKIGMVDNSPQGHFAFVPIIIENYDLEMGGFDFLIAYDASALTFMEATPGQLLEDCGWEYFTYRYGVEGNCGDACPSGLLRIIAMAETNDGPNHPACFGPPDSDPHELAEMKFLVTNDRIFECMFVPIRFFWDDCGDNTISSVDGEVLYVSNHVYEFDGTDITDSTFGFPTYFGVQAQCLNNPDPDKPNPIPFINFVNGGIDIICAEDIDDRGDINLNGVANEVADATVFTNYFIYGLAAFVINVEGQIAATDVNADGMVLTVGDLIYLIRVIVGDALPMPKTPPEIQKATVSTLVNHLAVAVATDSPSEIGGGCFVFEHSGYEIGEPILINGASDMTLKYNDQDGILKILVYSMEKDMKLEAGRENIFVIPIDGKGTIELTDAQLSDYYGNTISVKMTDAPALPEKFVLHQNHPNPFNAVTQIVYELPKSARVEIDVINAAGRLVAVLVDAEVPAGVHRAEWNGTDLDGNEVATGVYFYRIQTDGFAETRKMMLLK